MKALLFDPLCPNLLKVFADKFYSLEAFFSVKAAVRGYNSVVAYIDKFMSDQIIFFQIIESMDYFVSIGINAFRAAELIGDTFTVNIGLLWENYRKQVRGYL